MVKKEGSEKKMSKAEIERALIDNFITMQKVLTNLSVRFDDLSAKMEKLLEVFEISAKSFAEKYPEGMTEKPTADVETDFLRKLDALLDQNKTIAKGIMLMEEKIKNKQPMPSMQFQPSSQNQYPRFQPPVQSEDEESFETRTRY